MFTTILTYFKHKRDRAIFQDGIRRYTEVEFGKNAKAEYFRIMHEAGYLK